MWWILSIAVIGFLFTLGCGCGCCACTSCSLADDVAASYDVTITNIANGLCTQCTNANATYSVGTTTNGFCGNSITFTGDPVCVFATTDAHAIDCLGGGGCSGTSGTNITCALAITSDGDVTGVGDCEKTTNRVLLIGDGGVSCEPGGNCTNIGNFSETAASLLSCADAGDYESRNIPANGGGASNDCNWSSASCTVTRV